MANSNGIASGALISLTEVHEDRLQKVEDHLQDVSVSIAKIQTHQEYMQGAIDKTGVSILEKLEEVGAKVGGFEMRLSPIEAGYASGKNRADQIKVIVKSGAIALVGAIAAGVGKMIFDMVTR